MSPLLLLLACLATDPGGGDSAPTADGGGAGDGGGADGGAGDGGGEDGGAGDSGGDDGGAGDSGGVDGGAGDGGGADGDTGWVVYDEVQVADLAWTVHPEIGAIVTVTWTQLAPARAWVEYSHDAGEWRRSPEAVVGAGAAQVPLLGIPYGSALSFRVVNDFGAGPVTGPAQHAANAAPPDDLPTAMVQVSDPDGWDPSSPYLWTSVRGLARTWLLIVDRQGRVVWALQQGVGLQSLWPSISRDGAALLWDETDFYSDGDRVIRARIDGTVEHTYATPGHHHAFAETVDGAIAWQAWADTGWESIEEVALDGTVTTVFEGRDDWHTNALWWDEATDTLLSSYYTQDTILRIDRATGAVLDAWGDQGTWTFAPSQAQFWYQHGASLTPSGALLVSCHSAEDSDEAVVREYSLDAAGLVLAEVWSDGEGEGVEAEYYGDALRLPGGNTARNYGDNALVREVRPDGTVVWEVQWLDGLGDPAALVGHMTFLDDLYALAGAGSD